MCLEDLRLGRGRINRPTLQIPVGSPVTLNADQKRVAVMVAISMSGTPGDSVDVFFGPNTSSPSVFTLSGVQSLFILKVEELGQLVTGQLTLSINNVSGSATASVTEIYTEINAPPLDTYKP